MLTGLHDSDNTGFPNYALMEIEMMLRTLIRRIIIAVGWGAFWLYALLTNQEQDWHSMFTVACFVLFVQSFLRIGDDE